LTASAQPLDVARAFRTHFGLSEIYLADLNAIAGEQPAFQVYDALQGDGFRLWVDAGIDWFFENKRDFPQSLVAGLESLQDPDQLHKVLGQFSPQSVVFSLDLHNGKPLGS